MLLLWWWFITNTAANGLVEQLYRCLLLAELKSYFQHTFFSRLSHWLSKVRPALSVFSALIIEVVSSSQNFVCTIFYSILELFWWFFSNKTKVRLRAINDTLNNISVISWRSVLLVEETGVSGENHRPVASHWQTVSHNFYRVQLAWAGFKLTTLVVMCTDYIGIGNPTTIRSRPWRPLEIFLIPLLFFF